MARPGRMLVAVLAVMALVATSCSDDESGDTTTDAGKTGGTLVFGTSADPVSMDGAYVSDGESLRVIDQIFETLVATERGGTDPAPALAKSWHASDDGTAWTFSLEQNVKFHDGTDFNAAAVCTNFERWYNFKGLQQSPSVSYYWSTVFGGFKTQDNADVPSESLYKSCEAKSADEVIINLTRPSSSFLAGLAVPAFSIASPDALDEVRGRQGLGCGGQSQVRRDVRHAASDRHRPLQAREFHAGRPSRPREER